MIARHLDSKPGIILRLFASSKEGGVGEQRRLLASIKSGGIDEVRVLTCWIGHSETRAISKACRKRRIPMRSFNGRGQALHDL